jgi:hypothetical protein
MFLRNEIMIVFLEKVRVKTIFSIIDPVRVEPLELCYLKSVLNDMNIDSYIVDELFDFSPPKDITPDIVVLTGYNTAENEIIRMSEDEYSIKGRIVEVTSTEAEGGGAAAFRPVELILKKTGNKWLIDKIIIRNYE